MNSRSKLVISYKFERRVCYGMISKINASWYEVSLKVTSKAYIHYLPAYVLWTGRHVNIAACIQMLQLTDHAMTFKEVSNCKLQRQRTSIIITILLFSFLFVMLLILWFGSWNQKQHLFCEWNKNYVLVFICRNLSFWDFCMYRLSFKKDNRLSLYLKKPRSSNLNNRIVRRLLHH